MEKGARQAGGSISPIPAVKAFRGPLPVGERGIQFTTLIAPSYVQPFPGGLCLWRAGDGGVQVQPGLARIPVTITHVTQ